MGTAISMIKGSSMNDKDVTKILSAVAKGDGSFGKIMSKTISGNANSGVQAKNSGNMTSIVGNSKTSLAKSIDKKNDSVKSYDNSKTSTTGSNQKAVSKNNASNKSDSTASKKLSKANASKTTGNTKTDTTASDNVNEKVAEAVADLRNQIKEQLGVTDEQIDQALQMLGISAQDLLTPESLTDLVLNLSGAESAMDIITNGQLSDNLNSILGFLQNKMDELSQSTGMTLEELKSAIDDSRLQSNVISQDKDYANDLSQGNLSADNNDENIKQILQSKITVAASQSKNSDNNEMLGNRNSDNQAMLSQAEAGTTVSEVAGNLTNSIQNSFAQVVSTTSTETVSGADVIKQIIEAVKVSGGKEIQSMEIQLNPQSLGKVNLTVTAKNGVITAELVAQNEQVKKAMESQLSTLKENLQNQGIKVDAVEVTVQSHSFESGQNLKENNAEHEGQSKSSRKGLRLDSLDDLTDDDMSDEEIRAKNLLENENSSVEYTA